MKKASKLLMHELVIGGELCDGIAFYSDDQEVGERTRLVGGKMSKFRKHLEDVTFGGDRTNIICQWAQLSRPYTSRLFGGFKDFNFAGTVLDVSDNAFRLPLFLPSCHFFTTGLGARPFRLAQEAEGTSNRLI